MNRTEFQMTYSFFRRRMTSRPQTAPREFSSPPVRPELASISIVVPVRDNAAGIGRLIAWWSSLLSGARPRELLIVDDGSRVPIVATDVAGCRVLRTAGRGPAHARNVGWRAAAGSWVAFTDSDCVPDADWPAAFGSDWDGEVALQGRVRRFGEDVFSRFYDSQGILQPMVWSAEGRPLYLITANALVWREALVAVDGFDETFSLAAGEDVDLGLRVGAIGAMRWCGQACVAHDFEASLRSFVRRFVRYGRGNRTLSSRVQPELQSQLRPRPFRARSGRVADDALALVAFVALSSGWFFGK